MNKPDYTVIALFCLVIGVFFLAVGIIGETYKVINGTFTIGFILSLIGAILLLKVREDKRAAR